MQIEIPTKKISSLIMMQFTDEISCRCFRQYSQTKKAFLVNIERIISEIQRMKKKLGMHLLVNSISKYDMLILLMELQMKNYSW
jgi:hypothetical protein